MDWRYHIENLFLRVVDGLYARIRQPRPAEALLGNTRLVAHRGVFDNRTVFENSLAAFERAEACGVWGIELDVRWSRDLVPVVCHDVDARRLFGSPAVVARMTFAEIRDRFPAIPSLAQVVASFGKRCHLMIELKKAEYPDIFTQVPILEEVLAGLSPRVDYHLISLAPEIFEPMKAFPARTFLPIAQINVERFSRMAVQRQYRGVLGHYLFVRRPVVARHQRLGQAVGTGFVDSIFCFYREVNRGVDWLFTNRAALLQSVIHPSPQGRRKEERP